MFRKPCNNVPKGERPQSTHFRVSVSPPRLPWLFAGGHSRLEEVGPGGYFSKVHGKWNWSGHVAQCLGHLREYIPYRTAYVGVPAPFPDSGFLHNGHPNRRRVMASGWVPAAGVEEPDRVAVF